MANWLALSNLLGVYTSEPLPIALEGDGALTKLAWDCDVPPSCRAAVRPRSPWIRDGPGAIGKRA